MTVILTFVAGVGTPLKAYAAPDDTMLAESQALYSFTNQNGEELIFPTFEDYDIYLKAHTDKQLRYGENWVLQEVLASSTKQQMFVNYHPGTPN